VRPATYKARRLAGEEHLVTAGVGCSHDPALLIRW
jgi:hypothetical protein